MSRGRVLVSVAGDVAWPVELHASELAGLAGTEPGVRLVRLLDLAGARESARFVTVSGGDDTLVLPRARAEDARVLLALDGAAAPRLVGPADWQGFRVVEAVERIELGRIADGSACIPGIYPRSEALVRATRDLARGRTTGEAVEAQRQADRERLLDAEREVGLTPLADGMLDRQDLFRPLVEASDGLAAGALVRFLDGNTFYRAVVVEKAPRLRTPLPPPELSEPWLGTLPSPFALAHAAGHALPAAAFAESVLAPQLEAWAAEACALVVLAEPFLPREPERVEELLAALERLPRTLPLALQLSYGDASALLPPLAAAQVDGVGFDACATPAAALPLDFPRAVLAGVVDVRTSLLDPPEELDARARVLRERRPRALVLTPNGDLEHVPAAIAREKLLRLGAATGRAQE